LLLLAVGETDPGMIGRHKRLQIYELADFKWIQGAVSASAGLLLCPNVVSETSNMVRYTNAADAARIAIVLKAIVEQFPENYLSSRVAVGSHVYHRLGVTDAVLLEIAEAGAVLITDDLDLALAAAYAGTDVINYNHIRDNR